jgi:formylglycine-generating enzyme required for sulfatase activity
MEESRLFAIKAEEERKLAAIKAEEERKLAAIKAEEERKRQELMTKRVKSLLEKNENFVTDNQLEMLWVKPGSFMMGTVSEHDDASQHKVTLTKGFYLGKYEVTQAQYEAVRKWNPSNFKGADRPVDYVNWNDAVDFCEVLTEMEKKAGRVPEGMSYQLPTEAQWEYACRAGTTGKFSWGSKVREHNANYHRNVGETTPVGKYPANPWGFHDMQGNVSEWCADWYFEDYPLGRSPVTDPTGHPTGIISKYRDQSRVMRGGDYKTDLSWGNSGSAQRNYSEPDTRLEMFGFRVCLF